MTLQAAFTLIINTLSPLQGDREAANIAHIVMEHITGMGKMDRIVYKDKQLSADQQQQLQQALEALLKHEPVQYVTGKAWFFGLEFSVNSNVLIPRPETEELVEWVVKDVKASGIVVSSAKRLKILDIGTGSGAIPIALKKELPLAAVWSVDISASALEVARTNATELKLHVQFEQIDILDTTATKTLPIFDIIVSNPPYIRESEQKDMEEQVLAFEPNIALFVPDNDALLFYRQIGLLAKEKLTTGGLLYFEINEAFGKEVVTLLEAQGFKNVVLKQDIYGKDRMVKGNK